MRPIPLSPIDHVFTGPGAYPIDFVFAYPGEMDAERLLSSLRRALELFPPVSSRLVRLSADHLGLEPDPEGCSFVAAESGHGFADPALRHDFLDPVESREGEPLTRVRLTRTPEGSVLGVSMSHAVADGFSYFLFLASWSRLFRGLDVAPPSHERALLAAEAAGGEPTADELRADCGLFRAGPRPESRRGLRWETHAFPRDRLRAALGEAQAGCPVRLSHNDVMAATLWRDQVPRWTAEGDGDAYLDCPVDHRRLLPGLPVAYFGCAVVQAAAVHDLRSLASAPLGELALRVRRAVDGVDLPRVRRALATAERLRRAGGLAAVAECHVVHPRRGLLVTNLSRLPVAEVAFDAGPPVAFDMLTPGERCAVVLPAADGFEVRVCPPRDAS